jgi:outer membrane biosynthesis protein TonB
VIRFKVLPNGRIMDGSMRLEGSSGDVALDRAAWGALTGSNYAPLPRDFHGPYLELRAWFLYNMQAPR